MKEVWGYLRWIWQGFQGWQKMFIFAMFLQGAAIPMQNKDWALVTSSIGLAIILGYIMKWLIWDGIRASWAKYKSHRNELLTTIKNSDK